MRTITDMAVRYCNLDISHNGQQVVGAQDTINVMVTPQPPGKCESCDCERKPGLRARFFLSRPAWQSGKGALIHSVVLDEHLTAATLALAINDVLASKPLAQAAHEAVYGKSMRLDPAAISRNIPI